VIYVGRDVEWIVNKTSDKNLERRKTEQNKTNNKENKRREERRK